MDKKIEQAVKRKAKLIGKPSFIAPCTKADVNHWYKRNTLVVSGLIILLSLSVYAALMRAGHQDRFVLLQDVLSDTYPILDMLDDFLLELMLFGFILLSVRQLFRLCVIRVVGDKGFAFVTVNRSGTATTVNILLFEQVSKLTIIQPRGGIGLNLSWTANHWSNFYQYRYHPFFENTEFVNAILESWQRFSVMKQHRLAMAIKRSQQ